MMRNRVLVFLWMTWIAITNADRNGHRNSGATKSDIYIAGFFALSQHDTEAAVGRGVMPAIRLALKHVNDNPNILHDYKLHLYYNDTQCSASVGMKAFFDMMDRQPHKLMILGGSCTPVTDPLAKTSKHWRISILSFADTHPMFEKKSYPNFFRVVPSEKAFSLPRLRLLQAFNWTRVGTLYQNEPRFSLAHNSLVSVLDMAAVEIAESQSFVDDLFHPLSKLKEKDVRIILANMNATWARRVFCEAYKAELYGRRYQWIVAGPRQQLWWLSDDPDPALTCTPQQIEAALQGAFLVDVLPLTSSTDPTVSGLTAQEYEAQYTMLRGSEYSQLHGYAYDAIWTVAQTVDAVVRRLKHRKSSHPTAHPRYSSKHWTIADFNYRDPWWETLFLDALSNISFHGVTGLVKFVDNERKGRLLVKQVQGRQEVQIAEYDSYTDTLQLNEGSISWIGGKYPPKDRTIEIIEPSRISFSVFAIFATASVLGIAVASAFLAINVRFRNQRNIKMSSPYLNNVIIVGCLLTYTSVILLGLDSRLTSEAALPIICTARIWTLMAGFTLAFGSMFSKTWRVHSIFTDVKLNKKAIKDYQLFMVVGVLLIIDVAILTTWQVIDPFYRETKFLEPFLDPTNEDVLIRPENEYCKSHYMTSFVGAIYAYKGLLMAFGCFLAWETRNVNIPALNDSKYIGMSVYNVVIMCVIGAAISYILSDQQDVSFIIISIFIIFCTTGTLCLVFVPKLLDLRQNPQGAIEKRNRATIKPSLGKYKTAAKADNELHKTRVRNAKMRKEIKAIDEEIQKLLQELGEESECVMVRDGPSVSVKGDSDGKAPSVSGVDTISLSSIISSPDPTFTSPSHAKDNGDHSPDNQNGSPSREMMSTAGVAMWTAISNPLLLISQVMRKSMELGETDPNSATAQCEYVIERHASPPSSPILVEEPPQGRLYAVESHEPDQLVDSDYRDSPEHLPLFRCACHAVNQAAGSISLDELHMSERWIKTQPRSFSLEIVQKLAEAASRSRSRSRSASSFNYESEQDPREADNYFEYQSLESLGSTPTECNSTCVNYDETETPTVECFPEPVLFFPPSYEVNHNSLHETLTVSETSQQSPKKLRQRKKRPRKKETVESGEDRDLNNHVTCSSQSTPDMTQRKRRLVAVENSILPIFQQLIVQKHQSEEEVSSQRMASCPNLSIKCDVVEYF